MKKLIVIFLIFSSFLAQGTTYYISLTGNDATGTGSLGNPWRTLLKATQTVNTSGDIIHVNAGTFLETAQCNLAAGVSIEGEGVTSIVQSTLTAVFNSLLYVGGAEGSNGNQHISNVKFDGRSLATDWAIQIQGRKNVSIYNCTIENFRDRGVIFAGRTDGALAAPSIYATGNTFHDNIINNCGLYEGYGRGCLNIGGQDGMLIYNNVITQNQRAVGSNGWCIKGYNDGFLRNVKIYNNTLTRIPHGVGDDFDFAIELFFLEGGNEVYNNTIQGSFDTNFQSVGSSTYSLWIHDNTFSVPVHPVVVQHGIILEFDSDGVIIEDNTFTNITKCVSFFPRVNMVQNITIKNNLFKNIGGLNSGHFIGGFESEAGDFDVSNFFVYNNTFISDPSSKIDWGINLGGVNATHGYNNVQIKNNIFENTSIAWFVSGSLEKITNSGIQYNNAYGNGNSDDPNPSFIGSAPLAGSSTINNNLKVSPTYANTSTYPLASGSPLRDAGTNVGLSYMGTAPDISYIEFNVDGNVAPSVNAGSNQSITVPASSVTLTGNATDVDGTVVSYLWTRISGPNTPTIVTPSAASTNITGLVQGVYVFRLTATDDSVSNNTGYDEIQVTVGAAGSVPTANAGTDQSITLPTSSISLTGSGTGTTAQPNNLALQSETLDNATWGKSNVTITADQAVDMLGNNTLDEVNITASGTNYFWQTIAVTAGTTYYVSWDVKRGTATNIHYGFWNETASNYVGGSTISYYSSTSTTVSRFSTSFTAPAGCTSVSIELSSETPATGTIFLGRFQVATQSSAVYGTTTTSQLTGSAGSTITGYAWTKTSGPSSTITTPAAQNTTVTGLVQGVYVFRLTVTDSETTTGYDEVQITVNAGSNSSPTANAGNDTTIVLPTASTTIVGSGTDNDGTIASYAWTRISGPNTPTLSGASTTILGIGLSGTVLIQGTYVYRLTVTDNNGATGFDERTITVNAAPDLTPPYVVSTNPVNTATGVLITASILVNCNEPLLNVNNTSVVLVGITYTISNNSGTITIDPVSSLAYSTTYTYTVTGITDIAGNILPTYTGTFTTGSAPSQTRYRFRAFKRMR